MIANGGEIKFFVGFSDEEEDLDLSFCPGLPVVVLGNFNNETFSLIKCKTFF